MRLNRRELLSGSIPDSCHIASLVVQCRPEKLATTATAIEALHGVEIPARDERGKLVVLMEMESESDLLGNITRIESTPGVISVTLVYHQFDD
jgi:nitrate reductase NapD